MTTLRYVPDIITVLAGGNFYRAPVIGVTSHPPGTHKGIIRPDWTAIEVRTELGKSRWFGVASHEDAYISSDLRFVMATSDKDEVLSKWEAVRGKA